MTRLSTWAFAGFIAAFSISASAQILQDRPELCGGGVLPLPPGTAATPFPVDLTLRLRDGTLKTLEMGGPDEIRQVCPLSGDRLLVFGPVAGGDGYIVWILSQVDGAVLDVLGARDPRVSPDQHWLVYRKRYPTVVKIIFEEYLLYDLTRDAAANGAPNNKPGRVDAPGRMIFPVTVNRIRLRDVEVTPDQRHEFASETFFWSPDSRFVVFGDRTSRSTSVVVVDVGQKDSLAYVHELSAEEICTGNEIEPDVVGRATLSKVEFNSTRENLPNIWAGFEVYVSPSERSGLRCAKTPMIHFGNLKRAEIERHKAIR